MKDKSFVEYVVGDLFNYLSDVSARSMFGGFGIYRSGVMFALVAEGELYFKINEEQKQTYQEFGSVPFIYEKEGKSFEMSYWKIGEEIQENSELFRELAEQSYELALEKSFEKARKKLKNKV